MPYCCGVSSGRAAHPEEPLSGLEEGEQVAVDGVGVRDGHAVGEAGIDLEGGVFEYFGGCAAGGVDGDDLVVVAVEDEDGDVDLLKVFGEVRLGEGVDGVVLALVRA